MKELVGELSDSERQERPLPVNLPWSQYSFKLLFERCFHCSPIPPQIPGRRLSFPLAMRWLQSSQMYVNLGNSICKITRCDESTLEGLKSICLTFSFPDVSTICNENGRIRCYRFDTRDFMSNTSVDVTRSGAADRAELKPLISIRIFGLGSIAEAQDAKQYIYSYCAKHSWHSGFGWLKF